MSIEIFASILNWPIAKVDTLERKTGFFAVLLFSLASCLAQSPGSNPNPVAAVYSRDGRSVTLQAPGLAAFPSQFSALLEIEGKQRRFTSDSGLIQTITNTTESTPYGQAIVAVSTIHFEPDHLDLMLRLGQIPGVSGVLFQAGIRNGGGRPIKVSSLTPAQTEAPGFSVKGNPADWLITRLTGNFQSQLPGAVCALSTLTNRLVIRERGGFYRRDGVGFLVAPVGDPIAYLNSSVIYEGNGRTSFSIESSMSGVQVDPGETRWGQQAILLMEKPGVALQRQADWVAQTHHARSDKGALSGWCSWYLKTSKITGEDVLGLVDIVSASAGRLRPAVIQIDDGYQDFDGNWDANAKFPKGMSFYARKIAATGARPGLWMALTMIGVKAPWLNDPANLETVWGKKFKKESPFRPDETGWIDPTAPRAKAYIADRVHHAVTNGFTYLKLDFNNIGGGGWYEKKKTTFEILREHYINIRQAAGEGAYILFCTEAPDRATVGLVDASRTSSDAYRGGVRKAVDQVLRSYDLNGRWFAVDNDCYYLATGLKDVGNIDDGWAMVRTYASMMGLSSGAAFTSDFWQWDIFKPYWRMTEILTPPAKEHTQILDLCSSEEWPRLISHVQRPWGDWTVALLWNPGRQEQAITLDFAKAGLNPAHRYAVWSFWDNRFLVIATGRWETPALPASGCQHLCLTDLDDHPGQPVVIGSNLHIYCGAADLKSVKPSPNGINIELTDAGAREGDLFIYSMKPLVAGSAAGCQVKPVEAAGENVWRIHVEDREAGRPQKILLSFKKT